jgi:Dolichyl-phosphate-mannose-protein mannosyltransferase
MKSSAFQIIGLIAILAVGLALRLHRLGRESLWFDEQMFVLSSSGHLDDWLGIPVNRVIDPPDLFSVSKAGSWSAVWNANDIHPPLYPLALRLWREMVGDSDAEVRGLSVLASMITIVLMFDLGKTLAGIPAGFWAAGIAALAQPQIFYAQETRDYAMLSAVSLGTCCAAARLVVYGAAWPRTIAMGLCLAGMLLTHFFATGPAAVLIAWAIWQSQGKARGRVVIASIAGVAFFLVISATRVLPEAFANRHAADWLVERDSTGEHLWKSLYRAALLPSRFLAEPLLTSSSLAAFGAIAFVLTIILARRGGKSRPAMLWSGLWLWAGVGQVFVLDQWEHTCGLDYIRYTLIAAPAVYLLLSSLPDRAGIMRFLRHLIPAAAVVQCLVSLPDAYQAKNRGEWRELGGDVRQAARPGDMLIFASPADQFLSNPPDLYLGVNYYVRNIPCPVLLLTKQLDGQLQRRLRAAKRVWVVGPPFGSSNNFLSGWECHSAGPQRFYAGELCQAICRQP